MENKTGRNEPCPCGSRKKYKKCCLGRSRNNGYDELDKLMQYGYSLSEKEEITEACKIWLEVWNRLKIRFRPEMNNIEDAEKIFSGLQCLYNWCQDLEMELENAGRLDEFFYKKRIDYCSEFCSIFPETDSSILHNMKRAVAESYFAIGDIVKGKQCFKKLIEEYPQNIWGYIGWGDMYFLGMNRNFSPDYERAEQIYRMALDKEIDGKEYLIERLNDLQKEKETEQMG